MVPENGDDAEMAEAAAAAPEAVSDAQHNPDASAGAGEGGDNSDSHEEGGGVSAATSVEAEQSAQGEGQDEGGNGAPELPPGVYHQERWMFLPLSRVGELLAALNDRGARERALQASIKYVSFRACARRRVLQLLPVYLLRLDCSTPVWLSSCGCAGY